ncbi:unnamed protein product [Spirodela intermedia]|uniref:Uncharacterized protein n=1 Tax=Spirodela intermedia TaxID=51605 RepID=A0A7I8KVF9_SPIIN|nr:unnamed protein product [Spirodela intermedia]
MHWNPECSGGLSCNVHGLEGSPWTKTTWAISRSSLPSLTCTTTPCPTAGWPPVTWKGSGTHVPLSVQPNLLEFLLAATPQLRFRPACWPD